MAARTYERIYLIVRTYVRSYETKQCGRQGGLGGIRMAVSPAFAWWKATMAAALVFEMFLRLLFMDLEEIDDLGGMEIAAFHGVRGASSRGGAMERVGEFMSPGPIMVSEGAKIGDCARVLMKERLRHLPVVNAAGELSGIIFDHSVLSRGMPTWDVPPNFLLFAAEDRDLRAVDIQVPVEVVVGPEERLLAVFSKILRSHQTSL